MAGESFAAGSAFAPSADLPGSRATSNPMSSSVRTGAFFTGVPFIPVEVWAASIAEGLSLALFCARQIPGAQRAQTKNSVKTRREGVMGNLRRKVDLCG